MRITVAPRAAALREVQAGTGVGLGGGRCELLPTATAAATFLAWP